MLSGYVHPRPITALNHKGKHCRGKLWCIFAFVSQSGIHTGGFEMRGRSVIFLIALTNRNNMQRHASDWFWVNSSPHVCISKWLFKVDIYLCNDPSIAPLEWGWILLYLLVRRSRTADDSFEWLRGGIKMCEHIPWCGSRHVHLNMIVSGEVCAYSIFGK